MDESLPVSSVHGISQTRILEWVAISFSWGFSQPRDSTSISYIDRQVLYHSNTCCCYSVTQSCLTLCHLMDCSMPGVPAHHHLPEPIQTRVHWVSDGIKPLCPQTSSFPPAFIFPQIRNFSNELALRVRWSKYWRLSFNISPSNEYSELTSFRIDWMDLLAVQGTVKSLLQHHS